MTDPAARKSSKRDAKLWAYGIAAALLDSDMAMGEVPPPDEPDREAKEKALRELIATRDPTLCPKCGKPGFWRHGIHFDHEKKCGTCGHVWEPGAEQEKPKMTDPAARAAERIADYCGFTEVRQSVEQVMLIIREELPATANLEQVREECAEVKHRGNPSLSAVWFAEHLLAIIGGEAAGKSDADG